ncbi:zinc-binding dehydrogenase [Salinicola halophyticus]|uniref:zinc-binding dehydrogenase n=1 Tax=Salinicola halophyticus TaxID=1808881 RepID=UPI003F451DAF
MSNVFSESGVEQLYLYRVPEGPLQRQHIQSRRVNLEDSPPLCLQPYYFSVDPYMRTRMQPDGYSYIERWHVGSSLSGWGLARVTASRLPGWGPGDWALGHLPMQDAIDHDGAGLIRVSGESDIPLAGLHPLGMTGFTAWLGMCRIGCPQMTDTVLVGAAAGAVGSLAAQWARRAGARVIVTAGREDKRAWLRAIGFESVLDHRAEDYAKQLQSAAPEGVSLNFESLGGRFFEIANTAMRVGGRVVLCGLVSQYQEALPRRAPRNMASLAAKRVSVLPFVAPEHDAEWGDFQRAIRPPLESNEFSWRLDVVDGGLDAIPGALMGLLSGDNLGKRVVRCH